MTTPDFANDDVSGAFQRNGVLQVSQSGLDEPQMTEEQRQDWIEFMKDLWD